MQPPRKMPSPTQTMSVAKLVGTALPISVPAGADQPFGAGQHQRVPPRSTGVESRKGKAAPAR